MEPQQATTDNQNKFDVEGSERLRSSNASSSSSTRSSEFEDPDQLDPLENGRNMSKGVNKIGEQGSLESPAVQTMERPTGSSGYRIPSSVFARNKSGNPMDWSAASNESLFSIRNGNMSFTADQYNWLTKSGELYHLDKSEELPPTPNVPRPNVNEDSHTSSPSNTNRTHNSIDFGKDVTHYGPKEVITSSNAKKATPSMGDDQPTPTSSRSNASVQSFAFPVLEGGSVKSGPKSGQTKPGHQQKPHSDSNDTQTPAMDTTNGYTCSWFSTCISWFPCHGKAEKNVTTSKD